MIIKLISIILINIIFYCRIIDYGYVIDDLTNIIKNRIPRPKEWYKRIWLQLRGYGYWNNRSAHSLTIIIHTIVCIMIYLVFGNNNISFLAALLFALNPINNQISIWLSGKGYGVSTIFILAMFINPLIAPLFQWVALGWSVNGLLSSLMFIFTKYPYMALIFPLAFLYQFKFIFRGQKFHSESNSELSAIKIQKLIIVIKSYGYFFRQCLWPTKLGFYHKFLYTFGVSKEENKKAYQIDKDFWIGLVILYFVITNLFVSSRFPYGATWGLLWFSCNIAMWCGIVTLNQFISLRYVYLANCGMMLFLANMLIGEIWLIAIFMTYYATRLWYFMPMYSSDFWLTEYHVHETPDFHYAWLMRGNKHFGKGIYKQALSDYTEALRFRENDFKVTFNIAICYIAMGKIATAREWLSKAEKIEHGNQQDVQKGFIDRARNLIATMEFAKAKGERIIKIPLERLEITI